MLESRTPTSPRSTLIAGNWKMHLSPAETEDFLGKLHLPILPPEVVVVLFPTSLSLFTAQSFLNRADRTPASAAPVHLGVQHLHWEPQGAYTGEISAELAAASGASFALVGHSERRHLFGETLEETARKVDAAGRAGLTPILCVGETLEERRQGRLAEVLFAQIHAVLSALPDLGVSDLVLAYEPVWAIGTGESATPQDAQEAHTLLREQMRGLRGEDFAQGTRILYGGSVTPENAPELLAASDVDGVLVGGASLDPDRFARIVACAIPS